MGKNVSTNLSGKCCQILLDHTKQSATDALKLFPKAAEAGDLIGNRIAVKLQIIKELSQEKKKMQNFKN